MVGGPLHPVNGRIDADDLSEVFQHGQVVLRDVNAEAVRVRTFGAIALLGDVNAALPVEKSGGPGQLEPHGMRTRVRVGLLLAGGHGVLCSRCDEASRMSNKFDICTSYAPSVARKAYYYQTSRIRDESGVTSLLQLYRYTHDSVPPSRANGRQVVQVGPAHHS